MVASSFVVKPSVAPVTSVVDAVPQAAVQPAKVIRQRAARRNAKSVLPFPSHAGREATVRDKDDAQDSRAAVDAADALLPVRGCIPLQQEAKAKVFTWVVENGAAPNYRGLGELLAACGDLYRHQDGHALVQVLPDCKTRLIAQGKHLAPVIVDRVSMTVEKNDKTVSELPPANHLNAMLRSEKFLAKFRSVDEVTTHPLYQDDFDLARPGYNPGGHGQRILYLGHEPEIAGSTATIERLDVMPFASNADRTNTVAAALTVLLRRKWPGQKPVILVTSTKSHSGKGTITEFFRGGVPKADVLYESLDWPMKYEFQQQVKSNPEIGVVVFDNVRSRCRWPGQVHSFGIRRELCDYCGCHPGISWCGRTHPRTRCRRTSTTATPLRLPRNCWARCWCGARHKVFALAGSSKRKLIWPRMMPSATDAAGGRIEMLRCSDHLAGPTFTGFTRSSASMP